jgi:hypothetical protein
MEVWDETLDRLDVPPDPAGAFGDGRALVESPGKVAGALEGAGFENVAAESVEWRVQWTLDTFVAWRTRMGPSRRRLGELSAERRALVIADARARVGSLDASALLHLDEVVLASGRAPG